MILVILTAVLAVSEAAKLDRTYLPPITAKTADGSTAALRAPAEGLPSGSYLNDDQGVVVDAASPNTRTFGAEPTGLGGPRTSYGSTASKVGDAAFRGSLNGFGSSGGANTRIAPGFGSVVGVDENAGGPSIRIAPGFSSILASEGSDYDKTRASTLKFANEVGLDKYSYGFETDNGIAIGENGVAGDGINANGGYSYKGDDGKVYSVSYTADKDGYKPQGSHLPTPPPIPAEILVSLEQNAKDEAAGLVDDGSYDAQKYNDEGDYSSNTDDYNNNGPSVTADATVSGSFGQRNQVKQPSDPSHVPGSGNIHAAVEHGSPGFGSHTFGKPQVGAQANQGTIFPAPVPQNGFGVQSEKSDGSDSSASAIASTGNIKNNFGSQNIAGFRLPTSSNGNSAHSSAVTTGSGSASAYASTDPVGSGFNNEYLPPYFGSAGKQNSQLGSDSSAVVSAPNSEILNPDSSLSTSASAQGQNAAVQTVVSGAPFGVGGLNSDKVPSSGSDRLNNNGFYKPFNSFSSPSVPSLTQQSYQISQVGSNNANFASSPSKPALNQQQGSDSSYYYNQPSQVFPTPTISLAKYQSTYRQPNIPVSSSEEFKYLHTLNGGSVAPTPSSQSGQYQSKTDTSYHNGITQASISPFPSPSATPLTQFGTQSSQFGSKPSAFGRKPIVQSQLEYSQQSSSQPDHSQSHAQQGTIYEYNKPNSYKKNTSELSTSSKTDFQSSTGIKPIVNQFGSSFGSLFGQKPATTQGINTGSEDQTQTSQLSSTSSVKTQSGPKQISQKPQVGSEFQQTQFGFSAGSKPSIQTGTNSQQAQFGPSVYQSTNSESIQLNQGTLYEYNKPAETLPSNKESSLTLAQSGLGSNFNSGSETSQAGSTLLSQSQSGQTQFGQKPFGSSQVGSTYQQTQASSTSAFGQNPQSVGIVSTTISPVQSISQVDQKPLGSQTVQGSLQQTQFSSTAQTKFGQNPQLVQGSTFTSSSVTGAQASQIGEKPSTQTDSITFPSRVGEKPSHVSGFTSGSFSQNKGTKFSPKPLGSSQTQFGSTSKFSSSGAQLGQKQQATLGGTQTSTSSFGQKPFGSSSTGSQYGKKPHTTHSSSFTSSSASKDQSVQTQFGQKPFGSQTAFDQKPHATLGATTGFGSTSYSFTDTQLGQKQESSKGTAQKSPTIAQTISSIGQKPFNSAQSSSTFSQTAFGSSTGSKFGQKPHTSQGASTAFGSTSQFGSSIGSQVGQKQETTSSFGQKPFGSLQSTSPSSQTTFGSTTGSQFGQKSPTAQGSAGQKQETISTFGQKPFGGSQSGSTFSQTAFGSSTGSKFGQNTQTSQGTSTAFGSTNQFGSTTGSHVGQKQATTSSLSQKPFGNSQTGSTLSHTAFGATTGSKFGQKPHTSQGTSTAFGSTSQFGSTTGTQVGQKQETTSSFGQKPFGTSQTGSTLSQTALGSSTGSKFSQKPHTSQGTSTAFGSTSQFGSTTGSQVGQKQATTSSFGQNPFGSSQTGSTLSHTAFGATTGSKFGQKPHTSQGTSTVFGSTSQFGSTTGSQVGQKQETTSSFGQKPFGTSQTGSTLSHTAFGSSTGSKFGQKPHTSQGASTAYGSTSQFGSTTGSQVGQKQETTSSFSQKPFGSSQTGSTLSHTAFGATTGSKFGQKPHTSQGTSTAFGSTSQFGSTTGSQVGQKQETTSSFGQKPFGSSQTGSTLSHTAFGSSTGSKFGQKPHTSQGTSTVFGSTSQFGSTTGSQVGQKQETTSSFGQKPFGTSQTGSTLSQTAFGSSTGSKFDQKPHTSHGTSTALGSTSQFGSTTGSQVGQKQETTSSFGQKPFGSSQTGSTLSHTAFGATTGSKFGQKPHTSQGTSTAFGSTSQFGSTTGSQVGQKQETTSSFGQKPFGSSQTGSTLSHTAFGSSTGSKFGQKPHTSQGTSTAFGSTSQFGSTTGSQVGQKQETTSSFGQKPFGTSQTGSTLSQTAFGSSTGSKFDQKPHTSQGTSTALGSTSQFGSTTGSQVGQKQETTSSFGQKPFGSSQTDSTLTHTAFGATTGSKFGQKPHTSQGTSTAFGSTSQFGSTTGSQVGQKQETTSSFGQKPFGSSQTGSTLSHTAFGSSTGSKFDQKPHTSQGASTAFGSTSKFGSSTGSQVGQKQETTSSFGQKPFGGSQTGSALSQTAFGSSTGSQFGQKHQTTQGSSFTSVSKGQAAQTQFGQKPFGSTQSQLGSTSKFGSAAATAGSQVGQKQQTTSTFGQKPFGSSQSTSTFSQTAFGSSTESQLGQNAPTSEGSSFTTKKPFVSSQLGSSTGFKFNQFGSQSHQGSSQQTQLGSSVNSQFGQTSQNTSEIGQKPTTGSQVDSGTQQTQSNQNVQTTQSSSLSTSGVFNGQKGLTTQTGQKPLTSSQTANSDFSQAQIGSTSVSSTGPQVQSIFDYVKKPVNSQSTQGSLQQSQLGSSTGSLVGQNAVQGQTGTQFGSFAGSTGAPNGQKGYTTHTGQKPVTSSQTNGSSFSQAQIGSTSVASTGPQVQTIFDYRKKPVDLQATQGSLQQTQFGSSAGSQLGQNTVQGQTGQTQLGPFSSSQTIGSSLQQTQSGSTFGSQFGQKPQTAFGYQNSQSSSFSQSSQATNKAGSNTQTPFQAQISATGDKSSSATAFAGSGSFNSHTDTVEGYNYQKPPNPLKTPSRLGEQPIQAAFGQGCLINGVPISTPTTFNSYKQSSVGSAQIGDQNPFSSQKSGQAFSTAGTPVSSFTSFNNVQATKPTLGQLDFNKRPSQTQISFEDLQAASKVKNGVKPTLSVFDTSKQLSQNSGASLYGQSLKPEIGSIQSSGFPTTVGSVSAQDSSNLESAASPVITSISGIKNSFVGAGEQFGGPRNPPKFDKNTGYHY